MGLTSSRKYSVSARPPVFDAMVLASTPSRCASTQKPVAPSYWNLLNPGHLPAPLSVYVLSFSLIASVPI